MSDNLNELKDPRKRSVTSLTLTWLAERMRRSEAIRERIESGTYEIDPKKVAAAIVGDDTVPR